MTLAQLLLLADAAMAAGGSGAGAGEAPRAPSPSSRPSTMPTESWDLAELARWSK